MDLGALGNYPLPVILQSAYGVATAQELADQLGVTRAPTPALAGDADAAYQALKKGDTAPARALLIDELGVTPAKADEANARLPKI
jgi:hypothetical protein